MAIESYYTYTLPIEPKDISRVILENDSHVGPYEGAIDYAVSLGTAVRAAATGIVSRIRQDSDSYGDDPSYGPAVNYVTLDHGGEFSDYLHLEKGSVVVSLGERVRVGQLLAKTGLSGWMTDPHLHFMVYRHDDSELGWQCHTVRFE